MCCEYEPDGGGGFKARYPERNNHSIDMARYALEGDMRRREVRILGNERLGGLV